MTREEAIARLQTEEYRIEPGQKVTIDHFRPEDALGVTRCYFEVYGASFPLDHVYLPGELIRLSQSDDQHMFVARTDRGDIAGLAGIFRSAPGRGIMEAGQLMVLKSYRMTRVAVDLCRFAFEVLAPSLQLNALFTESLCNHVTSQKLSSHFGLLDCGLELDVLPAEAFQSEQQVGGRVALLQQLRVYQDIPHIVYLPPVYRDRLRELYQGLDLDRQFAEARVEPSVESSVVHFSRIPDAGFYRIGIERVGLDLDAVLSAAAEESAGFRICQAQVNLNDAAGSHAIDGLVRQGYWFGGLLPLWFDRDAIFLQKIAGTPHWDGIRVKTERAQRIVELIRQDWTLRPRG